MSRVAWIAASTTLTYFAKQYFGEDSLPADMGIALIDVHTTDPEVINGIRRIESELAGIRQDLVAVKHGPYNTGHRYLKKALRLEWGSPEREDNLRNAIWMFTRASGQESIVTTVDALCLASMCHLLLGESTLSKITFEEAYEEGWHGLSSLETEYNDVHFERWRDVNSWSLLETWGVGSKGKAAWQRLDEYTAEQQRIVADAWMTIAQMETLVEILETFDSPLLRDKKLEDLRGFWESDSESSSSSGSSGASGLNNSERTPEEIIGDALWGM
ncbi:hypothetical protein AUR64_07660 [Haloprofundus marisrubri]|uniref:Uncharacterized protein n=1 Tax=Haloprofundus marisrubri TaxID=1514971 RepID=A0A0W1RC87_9EURY|nr:hypothetical protein [Haloprofundus marisrubri]KTG11032.1 hypothetical protein AUR64_07660 [Haloprofundus marisrubri]